MSNNQDVEVVDGRRLRSERSRLAIIEAALALQEEGVLVPTAQQISDRAGVHIGPDLKKGQHLIEHLTVLRCYTDFYTKGFIGL